MFKKILLFVAMIFLLFLQLQIPLVDFLNLSEIFQWIDEIFSVTFFIIFLLIVVYTLRLRKKIFSVFLIIILFSIICLFSGIFVNENRLVVSILGTFDYTKNFLGILAFGMLNFTERQIKGIYNILSSFTLFICVVAIVLVIKYFTLENNLLLVLLGSIKEIRYGIPRVAPFNIHPNMFGLLSLLFFILDFAILPKINFRKLLLLLGIIFSVSRMVWMGFVVGILFLIFQFKIRSKIVYIFLIIAFFIILILPKVLKITQIEYISEGYYRGYVFKKSLEIFKDSPLLGIGPGMYGGVISVKFNSPIYEKYNFSKYWYNFGLAKFHSLDMFWPQILVECGIIGTLLFIYFLFFLYKITKRHYKYLDIYFIKRFCLGLSVVPIVIFFYLFGSGLNLASFLTTYSVFLGMCLGVRNSYENSAYK